MSKPIISVKNLSKMFQIKVMEKGIGGALKSLIFPKTISHLAIDHLNFEIQKGERVAFIGPNGAGKSTTIKMLTGILYPTSGEIRVLDYLPWKDRHDLGYHIGCVFGQRTQLWQQLPPKDTFSLIANIYDIEKNVFQKRLGEMTELFSLKPFINNPVRQLSLGERMRCEIVASLLHQPKILFLDEPTIGLDVNAKLIIRSLLLKLSDEWGTTLFLTSHDTADIEHVTERVIILDKGRLVLDSTIQKLKKNVLKKKIITLITEEETLELNIPELQVLTNKNFHFTCEVDLTLCPIEKIIHETLKKTTIKDMTVEDPTMEEIIRQIYGRLSA